MDAARFAHIQTLFLGALERPHHERAGFLDAACRTADGDPDDNLRAAVEAYLDADADESAFLLDEPLVLLTDEEPVDGRRVGPYRLTQLLGRGGMGAVYLAEREDVGREVALKVVRGDLADPEARQRFRREHRLLARLEHPGIARLYDVGVADDGTPYFAMERVEGEPLTDYCDRHRLGLDARLHLFEQVGRTVQHAHQHFVVHRDLKPSNVLVTPEGEVKLLDFGIAKALDEAGQADDAAHTRTGRRLLTPAYAAPEQFTGEGVTAATDVYSLGVLLYELLTGHRPHEDTAAPTQPPPRPSTAVTGTADTDTAAAEARQTTPERLARRLRGDLDVICLKALQPEPARRYASAEAFVEDVKRHIAGLPVAARPDAAGYRLRKFVARRRRGVGASVLGAVLLATVVGFYTVRLAAERDTARLEAERSERVTSLLTTVLTAADPLGASGPETPIGRVLEAGMGEIRAELEGQPDILASALALLGDIESKWRRHDEAQALLEEAYALVNTHDVDPATEVQVLQLLGNEYTASGNYDAAEPLLRRALSVQRARLRPDDPALASLYNDLGLLVQDQGRLEEAVDLLRRAIAIRRPLPRSVDLGANLFNLAGTLGDLDRYEEAIPLYQEARDVVEQELGDDHPYMAFVSSDLAIAYSELGRHDESLTEADRALHLFRSSLGDESDQVANALQVRGSTLRNLGRYREARRDLEASLERRRRTLPDRDPMTAFSLTSLGALHLETGENAVAERYLREALAIREERLPDDHWLTAITRKHLGRALTAQGDHAEAEDLLLDSHATASAQYGPGHENSREVSDALAALYDAWGRPEEAARYRRAR